MVTHKGYTVPYQLHCWTQLLTLLADELTVDEREDDAIELGVDERDEIADAELPAPPHTLPLTVGCSSAPPFLFN